MSEITVPVHEDLLVGHKITSDDLVKSIEVVEKVLTLTKALTSLTSITWDDTAVENVDKWVKVIKPYAAEPWVADLIDLIVHLFVKHKDPEKVVALVKEAIVASQKA